jgi:hypothetical protein
MCGVKMAKCGINKYDNLPARMGNLDIDYIRYLIDKHKIKLAKLKRLLNRAIKDSLEKSERGGKRK